MGLTKLYTAELVSLHQEFSNDDLGTVVALLVCSGINFVCARTGKTIQL